MRKNYSGISEATSHGARRQSVMSLSSRMLARLDPQRIETLTQRLRLRALVTHRPAVVAQAVLDSGVMWPGGPKLAPWALSGLKRDLRRHDRAVEVLARVARLSAATLSVIAG